MKLSHDLDGDSFQAKDFADATDLQDLVTLAQLGNLGPLLGNVLLELRVHTFQLHAIATGRAPDEPSEIRAALLK